MSNELKILSHYLLTLISKFSHDTLEHVKLVMKSDKSEFLHNKMYHSSMMEKYLKRFKDAMNDMDSIMHLIDQNEPKMSHSIENIYQCCVYDVYDNIEQHTSKPQSNPNKRIDIQIEFFSTFIRSFLKEIYQQTSMSKPFYFHRLPHQEQRQRVDLLLQPLLSKMVHPTTGVAIQVPNTVKNDAAGGESKDVEKNTNPMNSSPIRSSRVMHVDEEKEEENGLEEENGDEEQEDNDELGSVSSLGSKKVQSAAIKLMSAKKLTSTKKMNSTAKLSHPVQSAVILPEPIRSAKPLPPVEKDKERPLENLVINVAPKMVSMKVKPTDDVKEDRKINDTKENKKDEAKESIKSAIKPIQSSKFIKSASITKPRPAIVTPMKLQSDGIYQVQRQIHSATKQAQDRIRSVKSIKSTKIVRDEIPVSKSVQSAKVQPIRQVVSVSM